MKLHYPRTLYTLSGLIIIVVLAVVLASVAKAQSTSGSAQALEIGPPVVSLAADPGESITTNISIRDISNAQLLVTADVNDFTAADESGTPKLLLEEGEESPYSMKSWFSPIGQKLLDPRQIEELPVTINIPSDAAPGGYYAVVRFSATAPDLDGQGVSLSASIGSLIFLQVNGDANEKLSIESYQTTLDGSPTSIFQSAPIDFEVRIKNEGNLHQQPNGQIVVKDMFGRIVAKVNVNLPPRNILPGTIRKFEQNLDTGELGNKILFGYYTAELNLQYGQDNQKLTTTISFWVIPYVLIAIIVAILIVLVIVIRLAIRRYNRHILRQSRRRR